MLRDYKVLTFRRDIQQEAVEFYGRSINFQIDIRVAPAIDTQTTLYQVEVAVAWKENARDVMLKRSAFISNLTSIRNT